MKKASFLFLTSLLIVSLSKSQSGFTSSTPISPLPFEQNDNTVIYTATMASDFRFSGEGKDAKGRGNPFILMKSQETIAAIPNDVEQTDILINSGGIQYRDGQGRTWQADTYFSGGKVGSKSFDISGTTDDALYLSYRYASSGNPFGYNIPLPAGSYNITLHFMEPFFGAPGGSNETFGARVFHVNIEGQRVLSNYDIYAEGGAASAVVKTFNAVSVTDGTLNILFTSVVNKAIISAIEIVDASGTDNTPPTVTSVVRFNPTTENTTATQVTYQITFSEGVSGVDNTDFTLTTTSGTAAGAIASTTGSGSTYQVTVSSITGTGTLRLDVKASSTGIRDLAGNALSGGFITGEIYNIQQAPANFTIINGPYLQVGTQTAMTIRWRTDVATDSRIEVGTVFGTYPLTASSSSVTKEHEVRITGLNPDTKYYYRVGSSTGLLPGSNANYFKTAPPPNTTRKIRVAIFGDSGVSDEALENRQATVGAYLNYTGGNPAELILFNGDNAERDGTDADYQKYFFGFFSQNLLKNHVLFTAPGNNEYHEFPQTSRSQAYFKLFSMPTAGEGGGIPSNNKSFYSFNWGNIHFISLDSYGIESDGTRIYDTSGALTTWLKKDLAANTQKWTIAFFHHPPYTMGSHNSDTEGELIRIRQNFIRILERYGVDLVVNGHSHDYERSYLLNNYYGKEADFKISLHAKSSSSGKYNNSSNSCPYITASQTANHGTVYVVSASYFAFSTSVQSSFPHAALPFASYGSANGGMLYLEVEDNRLDARFIRRDGVISDQFTIMHDVNRTTSIKISAGETTQLTASWIGNYRWSTGATSRTISVNPGLNTTYRVTDNFGCLTDVFNVNVTSSALTSTAKQTNSLNEQTAFYPTQVKKGSPVTLQTNKTQLTEVTLVDAGGQLIRSIKPNGNIHINTEGLAAGVYFLILKSNNGIKTQKLIITN